MTRQSNLWSRFSLIVAILAGTALFLHSRGQAEVLPPRMPLSEFPLKVGIWQGANVVIPQWALDVLGHGEFVERIFARGENEPRVDLFIAYFPSQRTGSTMHSPQNCLPGSGWTPAESSRMEVEEPGSGQIKMNWYILAKGMDRLLVFYWYQSHGRTVASEYWAKFYLVEDAIRMNRSDGALVRISTLIAQNESVGSAEKRALAFVQDVSPLLDNYVPR
jgi:EpsI family protein